MNKPILTLFWSRRDFRLNDNPALYNAIEYSKKNNTLFLPIFCIDYDYINNPEHSISYPRLYLLNRILIEYSGNFDFFLITTDGYSKTFVDLSQKYTLVVFCNDDVEQYARIRDAKAKNILDKIGGTLYCTSDSLSVDVGIRSKTGSIYTVFTPFKNAVWDQFLANKTKPISQPLSLPSLDKPTKDTIIQLTQGFNPKLNPEKLDFLKQKKWTVVYNSTSIIDISSIYSYPQLDDWIVNEQNATQLWKSWVNSHIANYDKTRDMLDKEGTSKLSYALKWGLVSSRSIVEYIHTIYGDIFSSGVRSYISELIWREFYRYILVHFPDVMDLEFQTKRRLLEWDRSIEGQKIFEKWIAGKTGYDIVDACMVQLAKTGWMHNRGRMISASILTKNFGIDWRWGQAYFQSCLVDLDEASNNGGWQWSASVGVDPKPVRIFNPYLQTEKFDPQGNYRHQWLGNRQPLTPIIPYESSRISALKRYGLGQ